MNGNLQKALQYMFLAIGEEMPADFDGKKSIGIENTAGQKSNKRTI